MKKEELFKLVEAMPDGSDVRVSTQMDACGLAIYAEYDFTLSKSLGDSAHSPKFTINKKETPILRHTKEKISCRS